MFVNYGEEALSNFGCDILAVQRIKPDDVPWPILAVFVFWRSFSVAEIIIVAALVCMYITTTAWLAQMGEHLSAEQEVPARSTLRVLK